MNVWQAYFILCVAVLSVPPLIFVNLYTSCRPAASTHLCLLHWECFRAVASRWSSCVNASEARAAAWLCTLYKLLLLLLEYAVG